jgi:biotin carboxylase
MVRPRGLPLIHVVLVAPRFMENTLRYVEAFAALDGLVLSLVSEDPLERLRPSLRPRVAGHYRVASTLDGDQLTTAIGAIGRAVGRVDRVVGSLEQLQQPMADARERLGIEGPWRDTARNFRDKDRMKAVLREAGVPVARSALVSSWDELRRFLGEVGLPVVIKPQAGLGSRNTARITRPEELEALPRLGLVPREGAPLQVEEFVRAKEYTCETVTIRGEPVWRSGTRYHPGPLEVLENPWIQYCVLLPRETDDPLFRRFDPINGAALAALGMGTGLSHMEWFRRDDGSMLVSEVGARPPGVQIMPLMSLAHGFDAIAAWAELMAFERFSAPPRAFAAGAAFLRGQGRGARVRAVHGAATALAEVGDAVVELKLPAPGTPRAASYEGEGLAIVKHATTEGARRALSTLISCIRIELG